MTDRKELPAHKSGDTMSHRVEPSWEDWMGVWGSDEVPLQGRYTARIVLTVLHEDGTSEIHTREIPLLEVKGGKLRMAVQTTLHKDEKTPPA